MSLPSIMGERVKWAAFAVPPCLKKGHSSRLYGDWGGAFMSLPSIMGGHVKWPACVASVAAHPCV
jgi:hypothetical protein